LVVVYHSSLFRRYETTKKRILVLSSLRRLVDLSEKEDITQNQWRSIESRLAIAQETLLSQLDNAGRKYLHQISSNSEQASKMNKALGEIDLKLTKVIIFFDTYFDILTQRKVKSLNDILRGCDVIAADALKNKHRILDLMEDPIVFFDRGFGASIIREGASFPTKIKNPVPLLQIPYSRFISKYDLSSILHEAGHLVMARLGLNIMLPRLFRKVLSNLGAPTNIIDLYSRWTTEIGPDFWGFCCCGQAQTSSIKEILSLPPQNVFQIVYGDPHPPANIRVLLSIDWCRYLWGSGEWENWQREWLNFYPNKLAPIETIKILEACRKVIPVITKILFKTRFKFLNGNRLPDLFDMSSISPENIKRIANTIKSGKLNLKGQKPCIQLAVFRWIRDHTNYNEENIDKLMSDWLMRLGRSHRELKLPIIDFEEAK
jgi:hypothetical protein